MTELVPGLEQYCIAMADQHAEPPAEPWRRRRRVRMSALTTVFALSLVGGAFAVSAVWDPRLGDGRRSPATASTSSVPAEQSAALAVLRRPQDAADRGAVTRKALRFQDASFEGIRTDAIRILGETATGENAVLLPVARLNSDGPADGPAELRRPSTDNALCVWVDDPSEGGGASCSSFDGFLAGGLTVQSIDDAGVTVSGLVPDGVDRVVITPPTGSAVSASVRDNWFSAVASSMPRSTPRWLDASGKTLTP